MCSLTTKCVLESLYQDGERLDIRDLFRVAPTGDNGVGRLQTTSERISELQLTRSLVRVVIISCTGDFPPTAHGLELPLFDCRVKDVLDAASKVSGEVHRKRLVSFQISYVLCGISLNQTCSMSEIIRRFPRHA